MDIALIAVPLDSTKKESDRVLPCAASLNYGLLSIATFLSQQGVDVEVLDPQLYPHDFGVEKTSRWLVANMPKVVGLSCISGFSYRNLKRYCSLIRKIVPGATIVVGGQDHVGRLGLEVFKDSPEVDILVYGEGERAMLEIVHSCLNGTNLLELCDRFPVFVREG